jgi:hypothetical protein
LKKYLEKVLTGEIQLRGTQLSPRAEILRSGDWGKRLFGLFLCPSGGIAGHGRHQHQPVSSVIAIAGITFLAILTDFKGIIDSSASVPIFYPIRSGSLACQDR